MKCVRLKHPKLLVKIGFLKKPITSKRGISDEQKIRKAV